MKNFLRVRHYSIRTVEAYVQFIRRFILYHGKRHPAEMGADEIRQYSSHLAADKKAAASTRNVALSALLDVVENDHAVRVSQMAALALRNSWPNSTKVLDTIEHRLNNNASKGDAIATVKLLAANWAGDGRALTIIINLFKR